MVCGVGSAWDISGEDLAAINIKEGVNSLEYFVDLDVAATTGPPPLNNTSVVSVNLKASSESNALDD